ncbi:MAG: plasmid replication initiator TrfA [Pseudomonadota bacterium]
MKSPYYATTSDANTAHRSDGTFDSYVPITPAKKINEIANTLKVRSAEAAVRKYIPEQLSFWPEDRRAIANELARSALFKCCDNRKPRTYFDNVSLFMLGEGSLTYKGEELRSKDEDLFVTLAHRARNLPSGKMVVRMTSSDICKMNNWRQDQRYYNDIFLSIQRMKGGVITVFSRRLAKALKCQRALDAGASNDELTRLHDELTEFEKSALSELPLDQKGEEIAGMMLSLISNEPTFTGATSIKDGIPQGNLAWEITLDKKLVSLLAKPYLTLVDFKARQALTASGKRLQAYFLSHKKPFPVKLRSLEKMLGLNFADLGALKFNIAAQLADLKAHQVIAGYNFTKSADGTDWLVTVVRNPERLQATDHASKIVKSDQND